MSIYYKPVVRQIDYTRSTCDACGSKGSEVDILVTAMERDMGRACVFAICDKCTDIAAKFVEHERRYGIKV